MIKGLDKFKAHFAQHTKSFVLIGGVACHEWLATQGLEFRATRDIDIVLIVEALDQEFIARFWEFVEAAQYEIRERATGKRELYRFSKPKDDTYPAMLELFSRQPGKIDLSQGQRVIPVEIDENSADLSAILLDDDYYALILEHRREDDGLPFVTPEALIPLKARAWIDMTERQKKGEKIDSKDIQKHRTDVFRLGATLSGESSGHLAQGIEQDLKTFLAAFPEESSEWPSILGSLKTTFGNSKLKSADLIGAIRQYFRIA
ncbi:MAG TPA: nucleotidyl transferase AbiEii/AbiGii toxin family protein [Candidatus Sulfotelmatobacter sp.]|nr:nucleotidyl transferase AbiEii/AbiGii toxin family protein [Candidatus Sulfotelmatobacter sp.]